MTTLFDGLVNVHYRQFYITLHPDGISDEFDMDSYFVGQSNGLIGAAQRDYFFFNAPYETPVVRLTVNLLASKPEIRTNYDEIVEVNAIKGDSDWYLSEWAWSEIHELAIPPGTYRLRLSIRGFDFEDQSVESDEEYQVASIEKQHFLLEFYPSNVCSDSIITQTSISAKNFHISSPITKIEYEAKRKEREAALQDDKPWWKFW